MQGEQRITGHGQVEQRPERRRRHRERGVPRPYRDGVDGAEQPCLRPQQAGERQQRQHALAALLGRAQGRPGDQPQEEHVDHRLAGLHEQLRTGEEDERGDGADPAPEQRAAEPQPAPGHAAEREVGGGSSRDCAPWPNGASSVAKAFSSGCAVGAPGASMAGAWPCHVCCPQISAQMAS